MPADLTSTATHSGYSFSVLSSWLGLRQAATGGPIALTYQNGRRTVPWSIPHGHSRHERQQGSRRAQTQNCGGASEPRGVMHVAEVAAEVAAESETGSPLEIEARAHLPGAIARILGRLHAGESAELRTGDIGIGREEIGVVGQVGEGALQPQADFVRQRKRLGKAGGDGDR